MRPDFGLLTVAMVVAGQRHVGPPYVGAGLVFVASIVLWVRDRDPRVGWSVVEAHAFRPLLGMLVTMVLVGVASMLAIPRLVRLTERQFESWVIPTENQVGYTQQLGTAAPRPLVPSNTLVMRVYGPHVDYLRGGVYETYDRGTWSSSTSSLRKVATGLARHDAANVVEVRGVGALTRVDQRLRYFVPLGARAFGTAHEDALVDVFGVLRPDPDDPPTPVSFEIADSEYPPAPPTAVDLDVLSDIRTALEPLAADWTRGAATPRERIIAIERHLARDFTYTLGEIPVSSERRAIVQFLLHDRAGRCEHFATALALLGRIVGVPTRVVGGFRVAEHNAVGGYDVVREKNAHAWVEAWVTDASGAERWATFDGTPATEANMATEARGLAALGDASLAVWDRALELLGRARLWQFGLLLAAAITLLTTLRLLRARRERRAALHREPLDGPLPYFARLEGALASRGHARDPSEPLEWYAMRLRSVDHDRAADVVLEYSALRYGGLGDPDRVRVRALDCAAEIEAGAAAP